MTQSTDDKPTRRKMQGKCEAYVIEIGDRTIRIRPVRSRRGGPAEVSVGVGQLYQRLMIGRRR